MPPICLQHLLFPLVASIWRPVCKNESPDIRLSVAPLSIHLHKYLWCYYRTRTGVAGELRRGWAVFCSPLCQGVKMGFCNNYRFELPKLSAFIDLPVFWT